METKTYGWRGDTKDECESLGARVTVRRMRLIGDGKAVASCPILRCSGFLPDAARQWLLAQCGAAVASYPISAAALWLLAKCCAAVAFCLWLRCHLSSNVLHTDSERWICAAVR